MNEFYLPNYYTYMYLYMYFLQAHVRMYVYIHVHVDTCYMYIQLHTLTVFYSPYSHSRSTQRSRTGSAMPGEIVTTSSHLYPTTCGYIIMYMYIVLCNVRVHMYMRIVASSPCDYSNHGINSLRPNVTFW